MQASLVKWAGSKGASQSVQKLSHQSRSHQIPAEVLLETSLQNTCIWEGGLVGIFFISFSLCSLTYLDGLPLTHVRSCSSAALGLKYKGEALLHSSHQQRQKYAHVSHPFCLCRGEVYKTKAFIWGLRLQVEKRRKKPTFYTVNHIIFKYMHV